MHQRQFCKYVWLKCLTDASERSASTSPAFSRVLAARCFQEISWNGRKTIQSMKMFHTSIGVHILPAAATQRLEKMQQRSTELTATLSDQEVSNMDYQQQAALNKELGRLQVALGTFRRLEGLQKEVEDLLSLEDGPKQDEELQQMALQERKLLEDQIPDLEKSILMELLPRDDADDREVILEVRAGSGGEEASLFAADLFKMYGRFAQLRGWRFEPIEVAEGEGGGYKMASAAITGEAIYEHLKYESGVHRVQRVPVTETQGRVHTSAASVVIMPQADEVDVAVDNDDIRIDTYRSTGAGGQHVNTTDSAVRVTHIPTGIVVAIQDERSQHKNKAKALKVLRARIFEQERLIKQKALSEERKQIIGTGDRSERIRTYNFPQGRVTDHRVGLTEHNLDAVLAGEGLDVFIDALLEHYRAKMLENLELD